MLILSRKYASRLTIENCQKSALIELVRSTESDPDHKFCRLISVIAVYVLSRFGEKKAFFVFNCFALCLETQRKSLHLTSIRHMRFETD